MVSPPVALHLERRVERAPFARRHRRRDARPRPEGAGRGRSAPGSCRSRCGTRSSGVVRLTPQSPPSPSATCSQAGEPGPALGAVVLRPADEPSATSPDAARGTRTRRSPARCCSACQVTPRSRAAEEAAVAADVDRVGRARARRRSRAGRDGSSRRSRPCWTRFSHVQVRAGEIAAIGLDRAAVDLVRVDPARRRGTSRTRPGPVLTPGGGAAAVHVPPARRHR